MWQPLAPGGPFCAGLPPPPYQQPRPGPKRAAPSCLQSLSQLGLSWPKTLPAVAPRFLGHEKARLRCASAIDSSSLRSPSKLHDSPHDPSSRSTPPLLWHAGAPRRFGPGRLLTSSAEDPELNLLLRRRCPFLFHAFRSNLPTPSSSTSPTNPRPLISSPSPTPSPPAPQALPLPLVLVRSGSTLSPLGAETSHVAFGRKNRVFSSILLSRVFPGG